MTMVYHNDVHDDDDGDDDSTQVCNNDGNDMDNNTNSMDIHSSMNNSKDDASNDMNTDTNNRSHNSNCVQMDNILSTNMVRQCGTTHPTLDRRKSSDDVNSNGHHRKIPLTMQANRLPNIHRLPKNTIVAHRLVTHTPHSVPSRPTKHIAR